MPSWLSTFLGWWVTRPCPPAQHRAHPPKCKLFSEIVCPVHDRDGAVSSAPNLLLWNSWAIFLRKTKSAWDKYLAQSFSLRMAAKRPSYGQAKLRVLVWTAPDCLKYCLLFSWPYLGQCFPMSITHTALQSSPKQAPPGCKIPALPGCACDISGKIPSHLAVRTCCPSGGRFSSQELWKVTAWFTITTMQNLGMGKHPGEGCLRSFIFSSSSSSLSEVSWMFSDVFCLSVFI